ncbi:MAG: phosphoribosylaminoimidazolesuccinocarboxamide synthase [Rhodospirillales bacterium]|nr:MAG: phosphoribosylaminoimidazolesuccinocarboxamide synthase [Rhodospirillales bacterium]
MARRRQISEGKAKILYEGPEPGTLVQYFKDDTTAATPHRRIVITGKGVLNNRISEFLMRKLGEIGVPTHFVRRLNMREQLVREVEMIPVQAVVRSVAAGSFARRFGMPEGTLLPRSIVEYYYRSDELEDPMVSEEHITAFGWASPPDLDEMMALALRINDFLTGLFLGTGIRLYDVKVVFGRLWEEDQMRIVLADEIGPETCRLNDLRTGQRLDAEACRGDQAALTRVYQELARRLGVIPESGPADPQGPETLQ